MIRPQHNAVTELATSPSLLEEMPTLEQWKELNKQVEELRLKYEQSKIQLEKYTNNARHKKYYEQNKDKVKENAKAYLNKLKSENPDKLKEYRHRAYIKRKELKQGDHVK